MAPASTTHQEEEEDESWELVRAFAEDTNSIMGTIWPPRSYNCTYCGREFRSAQALGGHMNVHRRDRANNFQHQINYNNNPSAPAAPLTSTTNLPAADYFSSNFVSHGAPNHIDKNESAAVAALCLFCQFPSPSSSSAGTAFGGPSSSQLDDSRAFNRDGGGAGSVFHNLCWPNGSSLAPPPSSSTDLKIASRGASSSKVEVVSAEPELDLELRLGHT